MTETARTHALAPEIAGQLAGFARACKAAARAVSLYPSEHPAIETSLSRLAAAAADATTKGGFRFQVMPGNLLVDGRPCSRPDPAIADLATLLHDHLVAEVTVQRGVTAASWRTFLLLLTVDPQEVRLQGGIARSWTTAGGHGIELKELDYAALVKERESGEEATWGSIIANCMRTDALELDEETVQALIEIARDAERISDFVSQFEEQTPARGDVRARTAALLRILRAVTDSVQQSNPLALNGILDNIAQAATRLSPELMLQLLGEVRTPGSDEAHLVGEITLRMTDPMIARFVARSVATERGCTARLTEAFRALSPDSARQTSIVDLARAQAASSTLGAEGGFDELWSHVSEMLLSYSDHEWVSEAYNIELSSVRSRSLEIEHIPDDPPERISGWLTTVSDAVLRALDVQLLCDLVIVETDADRRQELLDLVVGHIDELVSRGEFVSARHLVEALERQAAPGAAASPDPTRRRAALAAFELLVSGEIMARIATQLNGIPDEDTEDVKKLCLAIGPALIPRLADALAAEQRPRARQRMTDLLMAFGEHGRHCVDQLRRSPNPSVRRTAVQLLRSFGGQDALGDLAELLDDTEAHVQREAVRALIAIAVDEGYALLEHALASEGSSARAAVMQELSATRDERAIPLFCYMVRHLECAGSMREVYLKAVARLGAFGGTVAVEALQEVLHKGPWWAPMRAREWRTEAAAALAHIDTPEAREALEGAALNGSFAVRRIARKFWRT